MNARFACFSFALFLSAAALAQTRKEQPKFSVASVKAIPAAPAPDTPPQRIVANPGSLIMRNVSLRNVLAWAYGVKVYQISCPAWMGAPAAHGDFPRYEIIAKAVDGVPVPQIKPMLQALLAERFALTLHRESKEVPLYELVLVKRGPELHDSDGAGKEDSAFQKASSNSWRNTSMDEFAENLSRRFGMPVLDRTGLKGRFDLPSISRNTIQHQALSFGGMHSRRRCDRNSA